MTVEEALRQHIGQDGNRFGLVGLHWDGVWSHAGGALGQENEREPVRVRSCARTIVR